MPKQLARAGHNRPWTHQNLVRICRITPTYDLKSCRFRIPLSCEKPHKYWVARVIQDRLHMISNPADSEYLYPAKNRMNIRLPELFRADQLAIDLNAAVVMEVERTASPVCTLMLLDLQHAGTVTTPLAAGALTQYAAAGALQGAQWLFAYEGVRSLWLGNIDTNFIDSDDLFGSLRAAGVRFY